MLNVTVLTAEKSVDDVSKYFMDGIDDYYQKEGDSKLWQGDGAERLGLTGEVTEKTFRELLKGKLPDGQVMARTQRNDSKNRIGIDFTFQAPKSVSIQALITGDSRIIQAHDRAVEAAVKELEKRAKTRQKVNGKSYIENTSNLIVAKFRHETNREKEPHLHTHAVALNATQRSDGQWRALVNDELIKNPIYYDMVYKSELAKELEGIGYNLRLEKSSFELAHISREQIEGMSTRLQQVDEKLREMGLSRENSSAAQRTVAARATRKKKDASIDRDELFKQWISNAKDLGINFDSREINLDGVGYSEKVAVVSKNMEVLSSDEMTKRAVQFAINHHTERHTIITHDELATTALSHGMGKSTVELIDREIERLKENGKLISEKPLYTAVNTSTLMTLTRNDWIKEMTALGRSKQDARRQVDLAIAHGRLVKQVERFTTQKAMEQERKILSSELSGRGVSTPVLSNDAAHSFMETTTLRKDQREAAELILCSDSRVIGVQGQAGVGKSFMSTSVTEKLKEQGFSVHILAPYGSQVKSLQKDGMTDARTVASFLHTLSREHTLNEKTFIYVDEAGVLPNRLMAKLADISASTGARLVLMGDTEQTKAVEAGVPFALLQRNGMETAVMNEIQRQKENPTLLKAVELAAVGRSLESLALITQVSETKESAQRYKQIANEYVDLPKQERDKTLVLTGTNESREKINELIRSGLKINNDVEVTALSRYDSTQAERRYSRNYNANSTAIRPERDYPHAGLVRGEVYIVRGQGENNSLIIESKEGERFSINPAHHKHISVYKLQAQQYGVGDKLVITRNDAALDVANGDRVTVTAIEKGNLHLKIDDREIVLNTKDKLHLDYAYVSTVHSAQGLTSNRVIANIEAKSRTVSKDWYYVAISRAKHVVKVYTDNIKKLPSSVARASTKQAAMELNHKVMEKTQQKSREKS
ncbi:conjugative relaxase [Salmonella enterica]|nr:conjugative relaxase [Salmonella enterica]EEP3373005.1 conjugative relaxase [Salmonella enterica]EFP6579712.1 conjugative relaxase [Salmonella enterica]EGC7970995.1 conjugative relaxase [Salmonella enterica]EIV4461172.1 conjugative relaxase [Salmonella enterica]